ncbi:hypothetical protein SCUCBS95973_001852 [Sporothrix curviconia]|uniref:Rhodopsin domain-containing protein n=1 Tax=Sporothrix curviconia TaxID=1260050 RepID=A0ABP0B217_9PEZI
MASLTQSTIMNGPGSIYSATDGQGTKSTVNGTTPYLYHHPHHGDYGGSISLVGVLIGILLPHTVCTLFVLARAGSRGLLLRKWFVDDSLVVAAWLCSTAVCVVYSMSSVQMHTGHDRTGAETLEAYLLRTYFGLIFYQLCLCLTKLSILALYLRMFAAVYASEAAAATRNSTASSSTTTLRQHHLRERRLAWVTVVIVIAYGVPLLWMSIMQCYPTSSPPSFLGHDVALCFSFTPLLVASASLHTATDAWLIVLVVPFVLTRLRFLPLSQRWALAGVLSLSVFVIAASLTRLQLSLHANWRPSMPSSSSMSAAAAASTAPTGPARANTLGFFVMTVLECDIALICASAPMLRPLLARLAPRLGLGDDNGPFDRRSGIHGRGVGGSRTNRRSLFQPRRQHGDEDSEDLTSVVSYHGYPWAARDGDGNSAPSRSHSRIKPQKNALAQTVGEESSERPLKPASADAGGSTMATNLAAPASFGVAGSSDGPSKPVRIFSRTGAPPRTPTGHSLQSLPRSLPQSRDGAASPLSAGGPGSGVLTRRPSSVFFYENSDFYDLYFNTPGSPATTPGGGPIADISKGTKKAGVPGAGIGLGIVLHPRGEVTGLGQLHENGSQESFFMGLNDPASPTRLTRLTGVSGYSGETYTEDGPGGSEPGDLKRFKSGSDDEYELADMDRKSIRLNATETSFLDDETDNDDSGRETPRGLGHLTPPPSAKPSPRTHEKAI